MNLLEYLERNLEGEKKSVAISLLNKPWKADWRTVKKHVPKDLFRRFFAAQREVVVRLAHLEGQALPPVWISLEWLGIGMRSPKIQSGALVVGGNAAEWEDQIWAQVVEDLEENKISSRSIDIGNRQALVLLYTIAHVCVFAMSNLHIVVGGGRRGAALARDPRAIASHRLYWFAHYMSSQSVFSDILTVRSEVEACIAAGQAPWRALGASSRGLARLCNRFLDKHLSLHPDYIGLMEANDQAAIKRLIDRAGLLVHIYVHGIWRQMESQRMDGSVRYDRLLPFELERADLARAGFGDDAIDELLVDCERQPVGDRLLEASEGSRLRLGDINLKYVLQTYCKTSLKAMEGRGVWFEKGYIANYIAERVSPERYTVYKGVDDPAERYDADVIIEDKKTALLYFCQVKHRVTPLLPHLRDEMKEYSGNSEILKGLRQIKRLRELIRTDGVLTRVRQTIRQRKLTSEELATRARYMMIHNSEGLDFCTSDGIAMYEWNMLRNLMIGVTGFVAGGRSTSTSMTGLELELDDPQKTMEALFAWLDERMPEDQPLRPSAQWEGFEATRLVFVTRKSLRARSRNLLSVSGFELNFPLT